MLYLQDSHPNIYQYLKNGGFKMLSQTLEEWVPNLWTSEQPLVNIATGKEAPQKR